MLSARFPIVSPAGTIRAKGDDERDGDRVVDGGYFENAGLTTALDVARALRDEGVTPIVLWVRNDPTIEEDNVRRGDHARSVNVSIGTEEKTRVAMADTNASGGKPVGMALEPLTSDMRDQLNLKPSTQGVVVGQVTEGSRADESGIQAGDVIERVAGTPVSTPAQVADAIHAAERAKKDALTLLVMRGGVTSYLGLQLTEG